MHKGIEFVAASAAGVLNTVNAYRPLTDRAPANLPVMMASAVTTEFPLQTMAWQQLATLELVRRGGLGSRAGRLAVAGSLASWIGLLNLHRVASRSGEVLEAALIEELGRDYRSRITAPRTAPIEAPLTRAQIALPRRGSRRRYLRAADQSYGEFGRANLLDVWSQPGLGPDARAPVLLQIPGGAWVSGRKTGQAYPLLSHLAGRGWVCVAINYRLSPKAEWPAHIADVKQAIVWIKGHIAEFGGDPGFVAVTGGSAGGHLSALAALTPGLADFQPGFEEADTTIQAAVPLYGVYDFADRDHLGTVALRRHVERHVLKTRLADDLGQWHQASPQFHIGPQAPPFFIIQGSNDVLTRAAQARRFAADLRHASRQPVVYAELPYAQHSFDVSGSVRTLHTVRAVERFLDYVYSCARGPRAES
jgi:acetyl esterase/lipase